jgi:cytidyltransferase-like protein
MSRVVVFGTFDIFHPGHASFLRQAKRGGSYLLVVVARDSHVKRAKLRDPRNLESQRAKSVRKSKIADKVILGSKTHNYFQTLRTYKIDKIVLGYDQKPTVAKLRKALKRHRLGHIEIFRARGYNPSRFKSSKLG